jgi:outer membrane lipoprotein-sorting protein
VKKYSVLSCILVVFLVSTILAGCGTSKTTTTETTKDTSQETLSELFTKGQKVEGLSYEYVLTINGTQASNGKISIQENKMRMETTVEGKTMITIADGQSYLGYYPDQKIAYKITVDQTKQAKTPEEYAKEASAETDKFKTLETTVYDGVKCRVISLAGTNGQEQMKMWIREDYGIPVRVETTAADGNKTVIEYKNLKIGKLPDDTFKLPADVQVTDMNDITKQLQQLPSGN